MKKHVIYTDSIYIKFLEMSIYSDKKQTSDYLRVGNTERQEESITTEESGVVTTFIILQLSEVLCIKYTTIFKKEFREKS